MDETSLRYAVCGQKGTIVKATGSRCKPTENLSLSERRQRFTMLATICSDATIQPRIPQILLSNGRLITKSMAAAASTDSLQIWVQESAWANAHTIRKYLGALKTSLGTIMKTMQCMLYIDCCPSHLEASVKRQAHLFGFRLLFCPCHMTRFLQPLDCYTFSRFKSVMAREYRAAKTEPLSHQQFG